MHNINPDSLKTAGYQKYPTLKGEYCTSFQKTVRGTDKKLYFINIHLWSIPMPPQALLDNSVSAEVRFYQAGDVNFDVNLFCRAHTTIREIEAFYADTYTRLGCIPDIHNND